MIKDPLISVCVSSNRTFLWKNMYEEIQKSSNNVSFEVIMVGPCPPEESFPSNFKYIKTANIKASQCYQIAIKNAQGSFILCFADDCRYHQDKGLDSLYEEYLKERDKKGDDKIVVLPSLRVGGHIPPLRYAKLKNGPIASLNSALINRTLFPYIENLDKRFVGVYWDCDLAMRLQQIGVKFIKFADIWCVEYKHEKKKGYLHKVCKPYDNKILNSFWVKKLSDGEEINPDDIWCHMKRPEYVVVKKRLKPVDRYSDKDILLYSQGIKEIGDLKWE